ncbi:MAG: chlorate reductase subunit gamma [Betaproteobacteria bacterium]|nr:MAG: chlorate reductase subunit gamma [Betaproteobacteria bacterium]
MRIKTRLLALVVAGLGAVAGAGFTPAANAAEMVMSVKTLLIAKQVDASQPDAVAWNKAPATKVSLQPAFPGHPTIVGTPRIAEVTVQAVRSRDRLFVRLVWDDPTANGKPSDTAQFADGVAIQFPVNGKASTTPFMGDAKSTVNIWRWRADGYAEELVADGFGTATSLHAQGEVSGVGVKSPQGWQVVLSRKLAGSEGTVNLTRFHEIPIAFAAWDGSNQERDGLKAVTLTWQKLRL